MKSIWIMFLAIAMLAMGSYEAREGADFAEGWGLAKSWVIAAGVIFFLGAVLNHWEHTRRRG